MSVPINLLRFAGTWSIAQRYSQYEFVISPIDNTSYVYVGVVDITGGADPSIPNPLWVSLATGGGGFTTQYPDIWQGTPPTTTDEALNRLSMILYGRTAVSGRLPPTTNNTKVLLTANVQGQGEFIITKQTTDGDPVWVARVAGSGLDTGTAIAVDTSGNVYATGQYASNPLTIFNADGTTFGTLANAGSSDAFIVKYNTNGFAQWATRIAGTGGDGGFGIAVDTTGNVHVTGFYTSNPVTIFNSDGTTFSTLANVGISSDAFIVTYDTNGFAQWATRIAGIAGNAIDEGRGIAVDMLGNVYVTGLYSSTPLTIFNQNGTTFGTLANSGGSDAFIVKYNSIGFAQWATRIAGSGDDIGRGIALDTTGNVYVIGDYTSNPVTIFNSNGTTFGTLIRSGLADAFIVKYDTNGFAQWATRIAGSGDDVGRGIAVDTTGNVYVTGLYLNAPVTIFNSNGTTFTTLTNGGFNDAFIVKYNTNGFAQWATRISGGSNDFGNGIAVDAFGNVYVSGENSSAAFYNADGTIFTTTPFAAGSGYTVKYDTNGFARWVSLNGGNGIGVDSAFNVYGMGAQGAREVIYVRSPGL